MVMREIVENLTKPLTDEEKKTGTIKPPAGPDRFTDTPDNLQRLFMEKRLQVLALEHLEPVFRAQHRVVAPGLIRGTALHPPFGRNPGHLARGLT